MRKIIAGLMLVLALQALPAQADWRFRKHDCASPADYVTSNAVAIGIFLKDLIPIVSGAMGFSVFPEAKGWAAPQYIGLGVSIFGGYLQAGLTPVGTLNLVLGLACVNLVDEVEPPPAAAPVAAGAVPVPVVPAVVIPKGRRG